MQRCHLRQLIASCFALALVGCGSGARGATSQSRDSTSNVSRTAQLAPPSSPVAPTQASSAPAQSAARASTSACVDGTFDSLLSCATLSQHSDPTAAAQRVVVAIQARDRSDFASCTEQFMLPVEADTENANAPQWILDAWACEASRRDAAAQQDRRARRRETSNPAEEFAPRETNARLETLARRFLCANRTNEDAMRVANQWARHLYDANHYERAAVIYDAIVRAWPDSDLAPYAAQLALDSINIRLVHSEGSGGCFELLGHYLADYLRILCTSALRPQNRESCDMLDRLACDVQRSQAESLSTTNLNAPASEAYERLANDPVCGEARGEEFLYNAASLSSRAGDRARSDRLFAELERRFPRSRFLRRPDN